MRTIRRQIDIDAPPDRVFAILMDFDAYPAWNDFTPRVRLYGPPVAGTELDLDCQMTPAELLENEREVLLEVDHQRHRMSMGTSRARGRPGIRSERMQRCEPLAAGRTRLINEECFQGWLGPVVYVLYRRRLEAAFTRYLEAVKARAEARDPIGADPQRAVS